MRDLVVIPARWHSTRFPGKPLASIAGRSLLHRVIDIAGEAIKDDPDVDLLVTTDHEAIVDHAQAVGCRACLTSSTISSGSARALAAARQQPELPRYIVNLQGDALFCPPAAITAVLDGLRERKAGCVTPAVRLDWAGLDSLREHKRLSPSSGTTCVLAADHKALWFSKAIIPSIRNEDALRRSTPLSPVYRHIGLYGYTLATLERFEELEPSAQERLEGLEQLRMLEAGIAIHVVETPLLAHSMGGVDTPEDADRAEILLAALGNPGW